MARKTRGLAGLTQRQVTWIWAFIATGIVVGLLYWEQIALLYVLATLSVTLLLVVVAFADLSGAKTGVVMVTAPDDSLPVESAANEVKPALQSTFGTRKRKNRR